MRNEMKPHKLPMVSFKGIPRFPKRGRVIPYTSKTREPEVQGSCNFGPLRGGTFERARLNHQGQLDKTHTHTLDMRRQN